ncbi:MAG TPA: hypothetical protein VLI90_07305, partial [Tepidisphaeraceae bacterium]|nr:hypothetical protein [Tepidisphaeraceae bacterium]
MSTIREDGMSIIHEPAPARATCVRRTKILIALAAVIVVAGATLPIAIRGGGIKTRIVRLFKPEYGLSKPVVRFRSHPINGGRDVSANTAISISIVVRNGKLDAKTMNTAHVALQPAGGGAALDVAVRPVGDDLLVLRPKAALQPDTAYTLSISGMKSTIGAMIPAFTTRFTTGRPADADIRFQKVPLPGTAGYACTAVVMGPDHQLYAGTDDGVILRFPIQPNGTLGEPLKIKSLQTAEGRSRLLIGFCFDPAATAAKPIVWVSHGFYAFSDAPDFTGKITRLSGPKLEVVEDAVIHLPRSARDHLNNQPIFGPDGALYFGQGSNTSYGAPDPIWSNRGQHLLNAAILRLDVKRITPGQPLDARTVDADGSYDPRSPDAPLTAYATGVRQAYDLVWATNGQLYAAINGSSAGGNTPAGHGAPALIDIPDDENDWLFHVMPGRYYGHPNALWNHFVLNGGNPDGGSGSSIVPQYPLGVK